MAIGMLMGIILDRGILRLVYGRDEVVVVVVLVTYAVFLIIEDVVVLIWGPQSYADYLPMVSVGNTEIGGLILSNYDMILVAIAALLAGLAYWALKFTRYGKLLTAMIFDHETAAAFGIHTVCNGLEDLWIKARQTNAPVNASSNIAARSRPISSFPRGKPS